MHTISIKYADDIDQNELWHAFNGLLGFLRHNGQLIGRYMQPFAKDGRISATFPTATEDALDKQHHNKYVVDGIGKLEELCGQKLEIEWVGYGEDQEKSICDCTKHKHFLLYYYGEYSPIVCGSCEKQLPLFKMPKLYDNTEYWNLTNWQSAYQGCVLIDLNCGTGERWAIRQQCDYNSGLSKQGREVAAKITEITGVKTYYFLSNFSKRSRKKDIERPCPSCGGEWHLEKSIHGYVHHKCDKCLLMSAYSNHHS
jgi:predicted  nucleic acid-binding Zn ribbon protein